MMTVMRFAANYSCAVGLALMLLCGCASERAAVLPDKQASWQKHIAAIKVGMGKTETENIIWQKVRYPADELLFNGSVDTDSGSGNRVYYFVSRNWCVEVPYVSDHVSALPTVRKAVRENGLLHPVL
ncbi:MAG: hypothetical protein JWR19_4348 [Pedosphaera sp.]|nr:hypothetical protein [Pedosphaera sp.]